MAKSRDAEKFDAAFEAASELTPSERVAAYVDARNNAGRIFVAIAGEPAGENGRYTAEQIKATGRHPEYESYFDWRVQRDATVLTIARDLESHRQALRSARISDAKFEADRLSAKGAYDKAQQKREQARADDPASERRPDRAQPPASDGHPHSNSSSNTRRPGANHRTLHQEDDGPPNWDAPPDDSWGRYDPEGDGNTPHGEPHPHHPADDPYRGPSARQDFEPGSTRHTGQSLPELLKQAKLATIGDSHRVEFLDGRGKRYVVVDITMDGKKRPVAYPTARKDEPILLPNAGTDLFVVIAGRTVTPTGLKLQIAVPEAEMRFALMQKAGLEAAEQKAASFYRQQAGDEAPGASNGRGDRQASASSAADRGDR